MNIFGLKPLLPAHLRHKTKLPLNQIAVGFLRRRSRNGSLRPADGVYDPNPNLAIHS
jgi:hypothetical protein